MIFELYLRNDEYGGEVTDLFKHYHPDGNHDVFRTEKVGEKISSERTHEGKKYIFQASVHPL